MAGTGAQAEAKPWVQVACVCDRVLIETDNVASLVRVVDTYTLEKPALPSSVVQGPAVLAGLTAFVSLKSGDVVGQFDISLRLRRPDGRVQPVGTWPAEFRGKEQGVNLQIRFDLTEAVEGLYWFDVLWKGDVLTQIPLRVRVREPHAQTAIQSQPR